MLWNVNKVHLNTFGGIWNNNVLGHNASSGLFPPSVFESILFFKYVAVRTAPNQEYFGTFITLIRVNNSTVHSEHYVKIA